jgi:hypothetical protein
MVKDSLIGNTYTYLTVVKYIGGRRNEYECLCKCGETRIYRAYDLKREALKSCGCWATDNGHHLTNSPTYRSWRSLRDRCNKVDGHNYHRYGARGITYDPRWEDFREFFKDMGLRPKGKTLDRIDNNGNYCKENCKWSTIKEQSNNTAFNIFLEYKGERLTVMQWADRTGMQWQTIRQRIGRGWSVERTLTEKVSLNRYHR